MHRKNLQEGFTAVELVVALALFGVVAATSYDALSSAVPRWRVGQGAQEVAAAVRAARTKAIINGGETVMPVDVHGGRYAVFNRWKVEVKADESVPCGDPLDGTERPEQSPYPEPTVRVDLKSRRVQRLPEGVSFVGPKPDLEPVTTLLPDTYDTAVMFDARGRLISANRPGYLYVGHPKYASYARVGVDFAGNVRVQRWDGARWR